MVKVSIFKKSKNYTAEGNISVSEIFQVVHSTVLDVACIYTCCFLSAKGDSNGYFILNGSYRQVLQWSYKARKLCLLWNSPQRPKCQRRLGSDTPLETDHNFQSKCCEDHSFVTHVEMENHKERKKWFFVMCQIHKSN